MSSSLSFRKESIQLATTVSQSLDNGFMNSKDPRHSKHAHDLRQPTTGEFTITTTIP